MNNEVEQYIRVPLIASVDSQFTHSCIYISSLLINLFYSSSSNYHNRYTPRLLTLSYFQVGSTRHYLVSLKCIFLK